MKKRTSPVSAFTLIEMLVVIAIITLLITLMSPAVGSALEHARKMGCLSNMRQSNQALLQFVAETGTCPPVQDDVGGNRWYSMEWVGPYMGNPPVHNPNGIGPPDGSVVSCRSKAVEIDAPEQNWIGYNNKLNLKGMSDFSPGQDQNGNGKADKYEPGPVTRILKSPSTLVTFADSSSLGVNWLCNYAMNDGSRYKGIQRYGGFNPRHNGGCNYAFFDGSARWIEDPDQAFFDKRIFLDPRHPKK